MKKTYRPGAVGALMDEYERATAELTRILESISDEEYARLRDTQTKDEDCRSIQTIMTHVVGAGYGYAGYMRDAWGIEQAPHERVPIARADTPAQLRAMLDFMIATLEKHWNLTDAESNAIQMRVRWGVTYDFEQLFEHAIVHVLRHRRQIERFLGR
ncbi:MAG TPA: DinB family protein [Candidatus Limnocylindrales bacterium]|nr:DinB family protein [Candidatus Limnocylindrales bacterium]